MILPCPCSGEGQLEDFRFPTRPVEYFVRCRECGRIGPVRLQEQDAIPAWNEDCAHGAR